MKSGEKVGGLSRPSRPASNGPVLTKVNDFFCLKIIPLYDYMYVRMYVKMYVYMQHSCRKN